MDIETRTFYMFVWLVLVTLFHIMSLKITVLGFSLSFLLSVN